MSSADATGPVAVEGAGGASRRMLAPLALAQFVASFAGSNMNVAINSIAEDLGTAIAGTIVVADASSGNRSFAAAMIVLAAIGLIGLGAAMLLPRDAGKRGT